MFFFFFNYMHNYIQNVFWTLTLWKYRLRPYLFSIPLFFRYTFIILSFRRIILTFKQDYWCIIVSFTIKCEKFEFDEILENGKAMFFVTYVWRSDLTIINILTRKLLLSRIRDSAKQHWGPAVAHTLSASLPRRRL